MRTAARATLCLAAALKLFAQAANTTAPDREYSLLRENEDWSFLSDSANRDDFWDPPHHGRYGRLAQEDRVL
jgi:hypothetical protein